MTKIIRRHLRKPDCTPTLVNFAEGDEDGWAVLPAWEVEATIGTTAYFVRGPDRYPTWKRTVEEKKED